ncbi:MAG TPA: hypothetical protein VGP68_01645 [Gemmataceae bacterium]|jgi:hypothetical protein|nr:hypothetical protein [Gemmataceae bacterium]
MTRRQVLTCRLLLIACGCCAAARAQEPAKVSAEVQDATRPSLLNRPLESSFPATRELAVPSSPAALLQTKVDPPLGYTGPSGIRPREEQETDDFVPMEDRWRSGFPSWDRYGNGNPLNQDTPYQTGAWWNPYRQNVLKGDYPIIGQHTFLEVTASTTMLLEERQTPIATSPFESTANPNSPEFFGRPNQFFYTQLFSLSLDLNHGDAGFKPTDWRVKITPIFDVNYLAVDELAVVNPDVTKGTTRGRTYFSLEEYFVEKKIADLSPDYDFVSVRVGSQPFTSDFRGFIFSDTNRAARLFGTLNGNRDQFNVIIFDQQEKDTNSELNTFSMRHQQVFIANYYRQDFIFPGYTAEASFHFDHDQPTFKFDNNDFLVRPDPDGVFSPHEVDVAYLGFAGDGHFGRYNVSNAFYYAFGHDSLNPLANQAQDISAEMAALELSYDRDWARFRTSVFWASGDHNLFNSHATGFDSIMDHPEFAGGDFSYWQRQSIALLGVNLTNRESLVPDLRSSKIEGQANFVNPGLFLVNTGVDFELTPRLKMINNCNFLWFDDTEVLKQFLFTNTVHDFIGVDLSSGFEYRPLLSNNAILTCGVSTLIPGQGFKDIYNSLSHSVNAQVASFFQLELRY